MSALDVSPPFYQLNYSGIEDLFNLLLARNQEHILLVRYKKELPRMLYHDRFDHRTISYIINSPTLHLRIVV